jgi:hypothetical protein
MAGFTIVSWRQYSPIDKFLNKFKRKGFLLYTGLVLASTLYMMYSVSNLPEVPKERESKKGKKKKKVKGRDNGKGKTTRTAKSGDIPGVEPGTEPGAQTGTSSFPKSHDIPLETLTQSQKNHIVYTWSKKELFSYLFDAKIFPDLDDDLDIIRNQVIEVYDKRYLIS